MPIAMRKVPKLSLTLLLGLFAGGRSTDVPTSRAAPGDRVASLNRKDAICTAGSDMNPTLVKEETVIEYYYAIESSQNISTSTVEGQAVVNDLEQAIFKEISPAILWCYYDNTDISHRKLSESEQQARRRMTLDEARRLSIVTFSTSPRDEEENGIPCNFPTTSEYCIVMHGMVTVIHHVTSDISLAKASILDATQLVMEYNDLFLLNGINPAFESITNVEWLGESLDAAMGGGPNGVVAPEESTDDGNTVPIAYAVSVPLLILLALALFVARNKAKRQVRTPAQQMALEGGGGEVKVLVGTGDPPRSFHEGMYHYTRHGARYLSTNCPDCIETKRNGFFTETDLETIQEGVFESFEDISLVATSTSASTHSAENDPSGHRKRNLVQASDTALGVKHSSIDVHQCTSSTCPICSYRPRDVAFVGNVAQQHYSTMFGCDEDV